MPPLRLLAVASLVGLGLAARCEIARADTLHIRGGGRLEGDVLDAEGGGYEVRLPSGALVKVPAVDVEGVTRGDTFRDEYIRRLNAIDRTDAEALYRLGLFCKDHGLLEESQHALRMAVTAVPDHDGARAALEEVHFEGRWMPVAEAMERRGLVRHGGGWVTPDVKEALVWRDRVRACAEEVRRLGVRVRSPEPSTRAQAAAALAALDDPAALEPLLEATDHWHRAVRTAALPALARRAIDSEAKVARRLAEMAAKDTELALQDQAADEIRARRLVPAADALIGLYVDADEAWVRRAAAVALGRIRYKPAFGTLLDTLTFNVARRKLVPVAYWTAHVRQLRPTEITAMGVRQSLLRNYTLQPFDYQVVADTAFNRGAQIGLKGLAGVDFDFDRKGWFEWWMQNHARFDAWMEPVSG